MGFPSPVITPATPGGSDRRASTILSPAELAERLEAIRRQVAECEAECAGDDVEDEIPW